MLRLAADVRDAMVAHATAGTPEEVCGVIAGDRADGTTGTPASAVPDDGPDDEPDDGPTDGPTGGPTDEPDDRIDVATDARPVSNAAETPRTRYEMAPAELLETLQSIEEGADVVGFYHSHPSGPAEPSRTDHARATWDDYLYVIVSLGGSADESRAASDGSATSDGSADRVTAWRWDATAESFREERVDVTVDPAP